MPDTDWPPHCRITPQGRAEIEAEIAANHQRRAAEDWRAQEVIALRRRVAALERALGAGGKRVIDAIVPALGDALRKVRAEERQHTADALRQAFEQRCLLDYQGVWNAGQAYSKGAAVTDRGALWIAVGPCISGERPGAGATSWRLAVKSERKHEPAVA